MHSIFWFRSDLRLQDNAGLNAAVKQSRADGGKLLTVFCLDSHVIQKQYLALNRLQFLNESLNALANSLKSLGTELLILDGAPELSLVRLLQQNPQFTRLFCNEDYTPYSRLRDQRIDSLIKANVSMHSYKDSVIFAPGEVLKPDGQIYKIFTPYKRAWQAKFNSIPKHVSKDFLAGQFFSFAEIKRLSLASIALANSRNLFNIEQFNLQLDQNGGESAAQSRLEFFTKGENAPIYNYAVQRNLVAVDGTSKLSAHLKFGCLSIRETYAKTNKLLLDLGNLELPSSQIVSMEQSLISWQNELIWREFYQMILGNFPEVVNSSFQVQYRSLVWENNPDYLQAWKEGETGYPFIDACMRQLNTTGWMHNRGRMAVAMFLTKDLLTDWRLGAKYFMQQLVDGDLAANNGGWQWSAGTGSDAAPYFRIFNPILQSQKADPDGVFIRKWVPELTGVSGSKIHNPWELTSQEQLDSQISMGVDYPLPIVDHQIQRQKALELYKR